MTRGVIYFNKGVKCLVRLFTSIFSLRKVYDGPVCVLLENDRKKELEKKRESVLGVLERLNVDWLDIEYSEDMNPNTLEYLSRVIHIDIPSQMTLKDCDMVADGINKVADALLN